MSEVQSVKPGYTTLNSLRERLERIPGMKEEIVRQQASLRAAIFVRNTRISAGLTQKELAARMQVTQSRISKIENQTGSQGASLETLIRVAEACGGTLEIGIKLAGAPRTS